MLVILISVFNQCRKWDQEFEEEEANRTLYAPFLDPYEEASELYYQQEYMAALTVIEKAIDIALQDTVFYHDHLADAYALKADIHIGLWHFVDAESTLMMALRYADSPNQEEITRSLEEVQGTITENDSERQERKIYLALPGVGPAGTLHGKVVIAYVFVDDGNHSTWSKMDRFQVMEQLDRVEAWLQAYAERYGTTGITFARRIFQYDRDPLLRNAITQIGVDQTEIGYDLAQRIAQLQGAESISDYLEHLAEAENAEQAVLLIHVNHDARSYAVRCRSNCSDEYAFLLETSDRTYWDAVPYVQAHEALHLFGADDLYNINTARNYAPRDIMHHYAKYLGGSVIDSLTAYAIGWTDFRPPTPFPIQTPEDDP